jgi:hypothetical protein
LTWKLKGTKYSRLLFQLQPKTLRTDEIESGLLLPTPCRFDYNSARTEEKWKEDQKKYAAKGINLQMGLKQMARFQMLPTPTAMDSTNATATMKSTQVKEGSMHSVTLNRAMSMGMLPTPTAGEHKQGKTEKYWENRIKKERQEDLSMMAYKGMLPTPKAQEARGNASRDRGKFNLTDEIAARYQPTSKSSQLNPRFVAEMMGFPPNWTELPFLNGEQNQSKDMETQ